MGIHFLLVRGDNFPAFAAAELSYQLDSAFMRHRKLARDALAQRVIEDRQTGFCLVVQARTLRHEIRDK